MPSPLEAAGAAIQPTSAAPLHTNEFFTGLWTNGSPLGPGAVPYLYARFYGASRFDRLIDGNDIEISPRLTPIRRPGHTVYNPGPFPPINRFFEFRGLTLNDEIIRLLADCDPGTGSSSGTVREVTQPSTNKILWTKDPSAGRTGFVDVGNTLYAGDGHDCHQWVTSAESWTATTLFNSGDFIIDTNGNIQMAIGVASAAITGIQVANGSHNLIAGQFVALSLNPSTPLTAYINENLIPTGLTTVPSINGFGGLVTNVANSQQITLFYSFVHPPVTPQSPETGTLSTGNGITGATQPVWQTSYGAVTSDGGAQWINKGSAAMPWGGAAPAAAPIVTQVPLAVVYQPWAASTWYAPSFVIQDSNGNYQQLTTAGMTGAAHPTWATVLGATTAEISPGTAVWTCQGIAAWIANHAYNVGDTVTVNYNYYTTSTYFDHSTKQWVTVSTSYNVTSIFQVITAGTSQTPGPPAWVNGLGTRVVDGGVIWVNNGNNTTGTHIWPGAAQTLSLNVQVLDSNNNIQGVQNFGESGATAPTSWATALGDSTTDNSLRWQNSGSYGAAATAPWIWAYSGKNSITGDISTASPPSQPLIVSAGMQPVIQGQGLPNPLWDTIVLWRTAAGGDTLLYDDEFPNPGPGQTWIYTDTNVDPGNVPSAGQGMLNQFITAPIDHENDPPPSNFVPKAYYLGRIFGYCNNVLRWSGGPDTVTGNGNSTFPPVNGFTLPSKGVICWPTTVGLICFTTTDIWALLGQGTDSAPFYVVNFQEGIGMASPDAFGVNGSTAYVMLTSHQVVSIDPGAGELEVGFPIADIFDTTMDPRLVYVTWHQGRSADTALYVANGSQYWYRMAAVSAPESGNVWSPPAAIRAPGQVRAMISAELTPGEKVLLLGPHVDGNPILKRDSSVHSDNGVAYPAHATIAPIVLAQPGTTAGLQFAVTEEKMIDGASPVVIKMLFDEMHDYIHVHDADWRRLHNITNDPPNLPRQKSFRTQRLWAQQDPSTVIKCRFYSEDISWPAEDFANELYTNTVYGRLPEKARK